MNPLDPSSMMNQSFFGKHLLLPSFTSRRKKSYGYGRMKDKQIALRRKRNKIAAKSRRINRIRKQLDKGTKRQPKKHG